MAPKKRDLQRQMNEALDGMLPEDEVSRLQARLEQLDAEGEQWERLRKTDELLQTTPMVSPPRGFADRVMAAILAMASPDFMRRELSVGIALGLVAAAVLFIPVLFIALVAVFSVLTSPSAWHTVLGTIIEAGNVVAELILNLGREIKGVAGDGTVMPVLLTGVILSVACWGWLIRYVNRPLARRPKS